MGKKQTTLLFQLILSCGIILFSSHPVPATHDHHPKKTLQSASELDYPPFAIVRPDGIADGFSVELLKAVTEAVDYKINISVGPWHEIKQQLTVGDLDVLPLVAYSHERDNYLNFTVPYLQMHGTIFVRKGESTQDDLLMGTSLTLSIQGQKIIQIVRIKHP